MKNIKNALKGSLDEMQERINKYAKEKREEHQRLIMMVKDAHEREKLSLSEIASLLGDVHRSTVHRWLKKARQLEANNESTKSLFQSAREEEAKKKPIPPE